MTELHRETGTVTKFRANKGSKKQYMILGTNINLFYVLTNYYNFDIKLQLNPNVMNWQNNLKNKVDVGSTFCEFVVSPAG